MKDKVPFAIGGALLSALLFWGAQHVAPLALFFNLFTPLPAAYVHMRCGHWVGATAVVGAALALMPLLPAAMVAGFLLQYGIIAFTVPWLLRKGVAWDRSAVLTVGTVLLIGAPLLVGYAQMQDVSPTQVVQREADHAIAQALTLYDEGQFSSYDRDEIARTLESMREVFIRIYPALATIIVAGVSLLLMVLLSSFSAGRYQIPGPPFAKWKSPEYLIWGVIAGGFGVFFGQGGIGTAALNLLIVCLPVYFLQGLAVVTYYLRTRLVSPLIRSLIYFLIFVLNPLPMLITGVGVFDLWIDFRKPKLKKTS